MAELGRETPQMRFRKAAMLHSFANNYAVLGQAYKRRQRLLEAHRLRRARNAGGGKHRRAPFHGRQRPHLPSSRRRSDGTRLSVWQCGQGMVSNRWLLVTRKTSVGRMIFR